MVKLAGVFRKPRRASATEAEPAPPRRRRLKKYPLPCPVRGGIIVALFLFSLPFGYLAYINGPTPPQKIVNRPVVWRWSHQADWNYRVLIAPSILFGDIRELGPGQTYFTTLVEGIQTQFVYVFNTDQPAHLEGEYTITAKMVPTNRLWEKDYDVIATLPFTADLAKNETYTLNLLPPIDIQYYRDELQNIVTETKVRAAANVTFTANVSVVVTNQHGKVEEKLSPTVQVPLTEADTFTIKGDLSAKKSNAVRGEFVGELPGEPGNRYPFIGGGLLLAAASALAYMLTSVKRVTEAPFQQASRKLRQRFAKRIVETPVPPRAAPAQEIIPLTSLPALAQVSNDLLKPIIYYEPPDPTADYRLFYALDGATRYEYRLTAAEVARAAAARQRKRKGFKGAGLEEGLNADWPGAAGDGPAAGGAAEPAAGEEGDAERKPRASRWGIPRRRKPQNGALNPEELADAELATDADGQSEAASRPPKRGQFGRGKKDQAKAAHRVEAPADDPEAAAVPAKGGLFGRGKKAAGETAAVGSGAGAEGLEVAPAGAPKVGAGAQRGLFGRGKKQAEAASKVATVAAEEAVAPERGAAGEEAPAPALSRREVGAEQPAPPA